MRDLSSDKLRQLLLITVGVAVLLVSARSVGTAWAAVAFPLALGGTMVAASAFGRLARLVALERELGSETREQFRRETRQQNVPRQVYRLLLSVAHADGRASEQERQLVRSFLLERFGGPVQVSDLTAWDIEPVDPSAITVLAESLRTLLSGSERETVFFWGCLVAFVDERFNQEEHQALQDLSKGLGLHGEHARRVFWHAKHAFLGGRRPRQDQRRESSYRRPPPTRTAGRERDLELLGLPATANAEDVRKRHRELVKRFHPDRHAHLGEAAAKEAAERFREVQGAYERLIAALR